MPLKSLLLFSEDFRPAAGGIAEYLHQVCKHLALAGVATTVATTVAEKSDDDLPQPYIVRRLPPPFGPAAAGRRVNFLARPIRFLREQMAARAWSRQWLGKLRREHDPQVVALGVWSPLTDWWALNCLGNGIPFVYFVYGKELLPRLGGLKGLCYGRSRRRSLRRAGAAIAISHATASAAIRLGVSPSKIALAMPGIDLSEWPPVSAETCRDVAASFRLEGKRIILSVSRLAPRKGIATMLEALPLILAEIPQCVYVIAGTGGQEQELRALVKRLGLEPNVVFAGHVSRQVKAALYQMCDVFVLPTRDLPNGNFEGFGIVFLEAAACAKPAVAGRSGGVTDAVIDGETGILVPPDSRHELARAVVRIMRDSDLARKLGQQGRARAETMTWTATARVVRETLDRLVAQAPPG